MSLFSFSSNPLLPQQEPQNNPSLQQASSLKQRPKSAVIPKKPQPTSNNNDLIPTSYTSSTQTQNYYQRKETTKDTSHSSTNMIPEDQKIGKILNEYERGMVLYDKGKFEEALDRFNDCLNIFMKSKIEDAEMCANIFLAMGISYYGNGDDESALELYNRCIQRLEVKFGKNFPGIVSPMVNIALIYTNQKKYDEALVTFQRAQKLAESKYVTVSILQQPI